MGNYHIGRNVGTSIPPCECCAHQVADIVFIVFCSDAGVGDGAEAVGAGCGFGGFAVGEVV